MALSKPEQISECGCTNRIFAYYDLLKERTFVVKQLQNHGLIAKHFDCGRCGQSCQFDSIRFVWRCQRNVSVRKQAKKKCNFSKSAFGGTWFEDSKLKVKENLLFCAFYLDKQFSYDYAQRELGFSSKTVCGWGSFIREVLEHYTINNCKKIGGIGKIVEIDEAKFGKRKYNKGKRVERQWVFGAICRETREFFAVPVERRDKHTLLAIIKEWILPGTIIYSDCWKSYDCLGDEGYLHFTVITLIILRTLTLVCTLIRWRGSGGATEIGCQGKGGCYAPPPSHQFDRAIFNHK